ncbi:MAG: aldehyde dehydrogenase family protein [Alphaproteobacteria bacterium]|nr:aldehyde dehydrogenase family protein [Alphaproteobacteria bacterium]
MGGRLDLGADGAAVIRCFDPRDLSDTGTVAVTPVADVPAVIARARAAQLLWQDQGLKRRKWAIADLHQAFLAAGEELVGLLAEEVGRPSGEAWTGEIVANHDLFGWWLSQIDDLLTAFPLDLNPVNYPRKRGRVQLDPVGVVGLVTPWNLPVAIPLRCLVPALLAGNAVVWKASEHTPRVSARLFEIIRATLPEGVVELVQGGGDQGAAVVGGAVDAVFFTGSVRTGRRIAAACAERFVPCSLELGGKDAAVVLHDAELERTVEGIVWAANGLAGQNCAAVERCYVDARIHDAFVDKVVARVEKLRPILDVGPLCNPAQLDIVKDHVADAVARGATVRTGGEAPGPGLFHQPTVLTGVTDDMKVMAEETFGPVLPIAPFDDLQDALRRVDGTPYGLTTSIWTRDLELGETLGTQLHCGVVTVNNHAFTGALPMGTWGGPKETGHGVTNSRFALYHLTRPRTVLVDALAMPHEMWWFPYNDALDRVGKGLIELQRKGGSKLPGARAALSGFINRWKD